MINFWWHPTFHPLPFYVFPLYKDTNKRVVTQRPWRPCKAISHGPGHIHLLRGRVLSWNEPENKEDVITLLAEGAVLRDLAVVCVCHSRNSKAKAQSKLRRDWMGKQQLGRPNGNRLLRTYTVGIDNVCPSIVHKQNLRSGVEILSVVIETFRIYVSTIRHFESRSLTFT